MVITAIRRYGSWYVVVLSCGCRYLRTRDEINREQLYVGKGAVCGKEHPPSVRE